MKKIISIVFFTFLVSCTSKNNDLFEITDFFVESLQTTYESYGILGGKNHLRTTNDGQYQVMPLGRLINVKILKPVSNEIYQDLKDDLKEHYENDKRVKDVYINNVGTIMIDCRN